MTLYPSILMASMLNLPYSKFVEFTLSGTTPQYNWLRKHFNDHWVEHVTHDGHVHSAMLDNVSSTRVAIVRNRAAKNGSETYISERVFNMRFRVGENMLGMSDQKIVEEMTGRLTYYLEVAAISGMPATWPDDYQGNMTKYLSEEVEFAHVPVEGVTIKSACLAGEEGGQDE